MSGNTTFIDSVHRQRRCSQKIRSIKCRPMQNSPYLGFERGPLLGWLRYTLISHIFHDCVGYCAANHMCYPLSGAVAMSSFSLHFVIVELFVTLLCCTWSGELMFILFCDLHLAAVCIDCELHYVFRLWSIICLVCTQTSFPLTEFWLDAKHQQQELEFLVSRLLRLRACVCQVSKCKLGLMFCFIWQSLKYFSEVVSFVPVKHNIVITLVALNENQMIYRSAPLRLPTELQLFLCLCAGDSRGRRH